GHWGPCLTNTGSVRLCSPGQQSVLLPADRVGAGPARIAIHRVKNIRRAYRRALSPIRNKPICARVDWRQREPAVDRPLLTAEAGGSGLRRSSGRALEHAVVRRDSTRGRTRALGTIIERWQWERPN